MGGSLVRTVKRSERDGSFVRPNRRSLQKGQRKARVAGGSGAGPLYDALFAVGGRLGTARDRRTPQWAKGAALPLKR